MSLKSAIVIITLITIVSLVGVGFATWTFDTTKADTADYTGKVAAAIEANDLEVKKGETSISNLYIICASQAENGIYWSTTANGSDRITQIQLVGSVTVDDNDFVDYTAYKGTFTCTSAAVNGTWISIAAINLNQEETSADAHSAITYDFTLPALSYAQVPSSIAEVDAMEEEANAISIILTFNFKVTGVVAA